MHAHVCVNLCQGRKRAGVGRAIEAAARQSKRKHQPLRPNTVGTFQTGNGCMWPHGLVVKDTRLSPERPGFESRWRNFVQFVWFSRASSRAAHVVARSGGTLHFWGPTAPSPPYLRNSCPRQAFETVVRDTCPGQSSQTVVRDSRSEQLSETLLRDGRLGHLSGTVVRDSRSRWSSETVVRDSPPRTLDLTLPAKRLKRPSRHPKWQARSLPAGHAYHFGPQAAHKAAARTQWPPKVVGATPAPGPRLPLWTPGRPQSG